MTDGNQPLVTVITPVLNRADTISACLESVSAQTYPNIEHIVIDGESTDGTQEVVEKFQSRASLRCVSGPDEGMYDAVNKGLELASGEILGYVNSDDVYLPWSVEKAVTAMQKGNDLAFGDMGVLKKTADDTTFFIAFYPPFDMRYYMYSSTLGQPSVFWHRRVTEKIGLLDISLNLIAECEYWLRAAAAGFRVGRVDEVLSIQLDHAETLRATNPDSKYAEQWAKVYAKYGASVGPQRNPKMNVAKKSLAWRRYQLRFLMEARKANPKRWSEFLAWATANRVPLRASGILRYLLPGDHNGVSWLDGPRLEASLGLPAEHATT